MSNPGVRSALRANAVSVDVDGISLLRDVTLNLELGQSIALVGHNGSGKTTLLRAIMGWIPMSGGSIEFFDGATRRSGAIDDIGALISDPALVGWMTPRSFGRMLLDSAGCGDLELVDRAFDEVGLDARLRTRRFRKLSQGQRQLAAIAYVLLRAPRLLILDEPFAHLDREKATRLESVLAQRVASGCALLFTCHGLGDLGMAQKVVALEGGRSIGVWDPSDPELAASLR